MILQELASYPSQLFVRLIVCLIMSFNSCQLQQTIAVHVGMAATLNHII